MIYSNKSHNSTENSYSLWRRSVNTKDQYCVDIDFIEYTFYNGILIPYLLIEMYEPKIHLYYCSYEKTMEYKEQQILILKNFSNRMNIPWYLVLSQPSFPNQRIFKIYNDKRRENNILSEIQYLEWLQQKKDIAIKNFNVMEYK